MIFFRVDGTHEIGMGHVFRCISLAKELIPLKDIIFFVDKSPKTKELIISHGFAVATPALLADFVSQEKNKIVIITDLIERDAANSWCEAIKGKKNIIHVSIHDLGLNQFDSNVVIDGSITNIIPYRKKKDVKYFLGKEYMILDSQFAKYNRMSIKYQDVPKKILLCFGGSDPSGITEQIVREIAGKFKKIQFFVVAGPEKGPVTSLNETYKNVRVLKGLGSIARIIFESDLTITSGGILLYEAACVGTPTIAICHDDKQVKTASHFQNEEVSVNLGLYKKMKIQDLIRTIDDLSKDAKRREDMGVKGKKLIDGKGASRVSAIIKDL